MIYDDKARPLRIRYQMPQVVAFLQYLMGLSSLDDRYLIIFERLQIGKGKVRLDQYQRPFLHLHQPFATYGSRYRSPHLKWYDLLMVQDEAKHDPI